jgi:prepilin-type processing-associated H-X9-DG protein
MKANCQSHRLRQPPQALAFTLVELMVVVSTILLLGLAFTPAITGARMPVKEMTCQSNLRQLTAGWILYSNDNRDKLCRVAEGAYCTSNPWDAKFLPGGYFASWELGRTDVVPDCTNEMFLKNGLLFRYVNDVKVYKCPADTRTMNFPKNTGALTVRSYSLNGWMNPFSAWTPDYTVFYKRTDIRTPSEMFVFIEENPGTINDGAFECTPTPSIVTWTDLPGAYHNDGACLSFADGHVESRKWTDPTLLATNSSIIGAPSTDPAHIDLRWMQTHSTYK